MESHNPKVHSRRPEASDHDVYHTQRSKVRADFQGKDDVAAAAAPTMPSPVQLTWELEVMVLIAFGEARRRSTQDRCRSLLLPYWRSGVMSVDHWPGRWEVDYGKMRNVHDDVESSRPCERELIGEKAVSGDAGEGRDHKVVSGNAWEAKASR